jgi:hypothetical protein
LLLGVLCVAAYDHFQVEAMRREIAALKSGSPQVAAPDKSPDAASVKTHSGSTAKPAGSGSPGTDAKRDIIQTERDIEREIAETRIAAKNAADRASESLTALQARLRDVQRRTKDLFPGGSEPATAPPDTKRLTDKQ